MEPTELGPTRYQQLVNKLAKRVRDKWHNVIGIDGEAGAGKSSLGLHLGTDVAAQLGHEMSLENVFYQRGEGIEKLESTKRDVFIFDEGGNIMLGREFNDRDQVQLAKMFHTVRQQGHTLVWCALNLKRLDIMIREDLLTHRATVYRRGHAIIQERRYNEYTREYEFKDVIRPLKYGSFEDRNPELWCQYEARKGAAFHNQNQGILSSQRFNADKDRIAQARHERRLMLAEKREAQVAKWRLTKQGSG